VPVHDLLDRIYFAGNLFRRYESAYPEHLKPRVKANLCKFLELSLDLDSGRYPSLGKFLAQFDNVELGESEQFDEAPAGTGLSKVRLMTIHAAKGLEAPVIFLVDATNTPQPTKSYQALVSWPSHSRIPTDFMLVGKKENQDEYTANIIKTNAPNELRENYNLLYVAATRAKQFLFISGSQPRKNDKLGWYGVIQQQYSSDGILEQFGSSPPFTALPKLDKSDADKFTIDKKLTQAIKLRPKQVEIKPSEMANESAYTQMGVSFSNNDLPTELEPENYKKGLYKKGLNGGVSAELRGQVIHRILQLLCENTAILTIRQLILSENNIDLDKPVYSDWLQEATASFEHESTKSIFDPSFYSKAFSEIPLYYQFNGHPVYGIIDRLVLTPDKIIIVDYKTHTNIDQDSQSLLLEHYKVQLDYYSAGAKKLWPDKSVCPMILFTHNINLVSI